MTTLLNNNKNSHLLSCYLILSNVLQTLNVHNEITVHVITVILVTAKQQVLILLESQNSIQLPIQCHIL